MAVFKGHQANGCYKVPGVSHTDWDGYNNRPTRPRLKREDRTLLSEALSDSLEPDDLPGAFGEGQRRPRRERRKYTAAERQLRWQYRFKEWMKTLKTMRP